MTDPAPIIDIQNLKMHFPVKTGVLNRTTHHVKAVDGVDLKINPGETLGLVGESGCGKTSIGRALTRVYKPTSGAIHYKGEALPATDIASLSHAQMKPYWQKIRMIFQDPFLSLNPRMTVFDIIAEPLRIQGVSTADQKTRVAELMEKCGLSPIFMRRYPHAFSGGQRQRIGIARALSLSPEVVVADEAVSALDVSVRAQILILMKQLQQQEGLTYLFISHDLSVVEYVSDRIAVMYIGRVVELSDNRDLFLSPKHPYTESLLSAIPNPDPSRKSKRIILPGEVADPANPPSGCHFHPRCPYAQEKCRREAPALRKISENHHAACHFAESLDLQGIKARAA